MRVDLFTFSRDLDSIMLSEFPGKIIPKKQYHVDKSDEDKMFCFYDLEYSQLHPFLSRYSHSHEFEVRQNDGKILWVNTPERSFEVH